MGRSVASRWEFHAMSGIFQGGTKKIHRLEGWLGVEEGTGNSYKPKEKQEEE